MQIDVFNGDADGICALVQLRLAQPTESMLVTGVKRDIELLRRVQAKQGDCVTVLDISLDKNRTELNRILNEGADVFYVDHHFSGAIPSHPTLKTRINTDANICTSLLIDAYLNGKFRHWTITAAFGDNLNAVATQVAIDCGLKTEQINQLQNLGICLNYNGYGAELSDLHFAPDALFGELVHYESPFDFMIDNKQTHQKLLMGYEEDMNNAFQIPTEYETQKIAVYLLPNEAWARRVSGVFGNALANKYPHRAHAIVTDNMQAGYLVSVRASLETKTGADGLCALFSTGGGRKSAAGINHLPKEQLATFIDRFAKQMG